MTRDGWIAVSVGAVLTVVLTFPTAFQPATRARIDTGDGRFSVWNVAWVARALVTDPVHVMDANIFHPHKGTLAYSEANLVAGVLAVPVYAVTRHPVAAHNSAVLLGFLLSYVAMWALVRRLSGSQAAGLVAGTIFAFAPFVSARTPHIQLLMVFVFPLTALAFHRFQDAPTPGRAIGLGAALATAALANGYFGLYAGWMVGLACIWFGVGHKERRRFWVGTAVAAGVAAALVAPVIRPYLELRSSQGARRTTSVEELRGYSADARAYLASPARAHQWLARVAGRGREVLFPGLVATSLGVAGAWVVLARRRGAGGAERGASPRRVAWFYLTLGGLGAWVSFGPDAGLYAVMDRVLPFMSFMRAPARAGIVATFALAVLSGFAVAAAAARKGPLLALVLVPLSAAELAAIPWPLRVVPPVPEAYRVLGTLPRGATVQLRFEYRSADLWGQHTYSMFWSTWHWQPLVNGYSDFIPPDFREIMRPINFFPDAESFAIMRARDVRYVLIDWANYTDAGRAAIRARFPPYGDAIRTVVDREDVSLFEILRYPDAR